MTLSYPEHPSHMTDLVLKWMVVGWHDYPLENFPGTDRGEVKLTINLLTDDRQAIAEDWVNNQARVLGLESLNAQDKVGRKIKWSLDVPSHLPLPSALWQQYQAPSGEGRWYELQAKACRAYIEKRPVHCDRGRWLAKIEPQGSMKDILKLSLDSQDRFPRYYFNLLFAALEVEAFLRRREQWPLPDDLTPLKIHAPDEGRDNGRPA